MSRVHLLAAAAVIVCTAANAQSDMRVPPAAANTADKINAAPPDINASTDLAAVPEPKRTLTNLTVYSRGVDIGHVAKVELDNVGAPRRLEIAFNSDARPVWIDASRVHYDSAKRQITTALDVQTLHDLSATRIH